MSSEGNEKEGTRRWKIGEKEKQGRIGRDWERETEQNQIETHWMNLVNGLEDTPRGPEERPQPEGVQISVPKDL